jgi:hypothetical protein
LTTLTNYCTDNDRKRDNVIEEMRDGEISQERKRQGVLGGGRTEREGRRRQE